MNADPPVNPADEAGDVGEVVRFDVVTHGTTPRSCTSSARSTR